MGDRLTEAIDDSENWPYGIPAAVLALIQSEEAHQAITNAACLDYPNDPCSGVGTKHPGCAQAALVAFLKENPNG